jgi:hypothetical protein
VVIIAAADQLQPDSPLGQAPPVATACRAIATIIDQGEGTAGTPSEIAGADLAHYYRFAQIADGHRLVRNPAAAPTAPPKEQWVYTDAPVFVDEASIFKVPANPVTADYPVGSRAWRACVTFNYTYTSLLKSLHTAVNGNPGCLEASTAPLMRALRQQGMDMMSGQATGGVPAGPTFEWQPVNA